MFSIGNVNLIAKVTDLALSADEHSLSNDSSASVHEQMSDPSLLSLSMSKAQVEYRPQQCIERIGCRTALRYRAL